MYLLTEKWYQELSHSRLDPDINIAIANLYIKDMKKLMALASLLSMIFTTAGLWLSYTLNFTSGATVVLCAAVVYLVSLGVNFLWQSLRLQGKQSL